MSNYSFTINPAMKKIAVFGGAACTDEDYYFPVAYETGKLLARAGFTTITGARPGMMHHSLKGAHDVGGKNHRRSTKCERAKEV